MQLLINALIAGSFAALLAGGLALVYGVLGVFNLALGQSVLFGGYITWWLTQVAGWPILPAIAGGILSGALLAWFTFEVFIAPFYKHHRFLPLVTTIAWSMILDGIILLLFEERARSILPGTRRLIRLGAAHITVQQIVLIVVTLLLLCIVAWVLHSTSFGRRIRAVAEHPQAALSLGIPSPVLHRILFIVSGILAAAGGIFLGIDQNLSPAFSFPLTIRAYAAIIAGGKGNIWGAIICAYAIALLEQLVVGVHWFGFFYVPAGFQATIALLVIIVFLIVRPQGLFSSGRRTA
ncbi:branched-chain amino acid ABC transporter permease [Candidatus Peregrinibacteria bacterium]|nr:branched-chain amino acid ABC transporter permease [Candidatus Peregrinibacteria bacterium]